MKTVEYGLRLPKRGKKIILLCYYVIQNISSHVTLDIKDNLI